MYIIIAGGGVIGFHIASLLTEEGQEVVIEEKSEEVLENLRRQLDVKTIQGNAATPKILRQAEAEREKRAVIIKSQGELTAAHNLEEAVQQMSNRALYLRTLSSLEDISYDQSNTIVFAIPMDMVKGEIVGLSAFAEANKVPKSVRSQGSPDASSSKRR